MSSAYNHQYHNVHYEFDPNGPNQQQFEPSAPSSVAGQARVPPSPVSPYAPPYPLPPVEYVARPYLPPPHAYGIPPAPSRIYAAAGTSALQTAFTHTPVPVPVAPPPAQPQNLSLDQTLALHLAECGLFSSLGLGNNGSEDSGSSSAPRSRRKLRWPRAVSTEERLVLVLRFIQLAGFDNIAGSALAKPAVEVTPLILSARYMPTEKPSIGTIVSKNNLVLICRAMLDHLQHGSHPTPRRKRRRWEKRDAETLREMHSTPGLSRA
ncbi:hypothetical protein EV715DRAFT_297611 [Schizophyllum commune]